MNKLLLAVIIGALALSAYQRASPPTLAMEAAGSAAQAGGEPIQA